MAVEPNYSVPGWLHGANPLEAITSGASLGIRIAEANQRAAIAYSELQRRNQEFAQTIAMHQQQLEREQEFQQQRFQAEQQIQEQNQMRNDQKLMIDNAYKQGQLGLKQQQLELTAKAAAEKSAASGRFLQSLNTLTSGYMAEEGMTEEQARAKAVPQAIYDSGLFQYVSPSSLAAMAKSAAGTREGEWKTSPGGYPYYQTAQGGLHFEPRENEKAIPEPKFSIMPGVGARPGRITGVTGVTADQLGQLGVTNQYNFKKRAEATPQTSASPFKDGTQLRKGDDLYEVQGGLPVLKEKDHFKTEPQSSTEEEPAAEEA